MSVSSVYGLNKKDIPRAVECLKDAFKEDPLWREVFKNDPDRENAMSGFYTCPLLYGLKFGKAYAVSPEIEGIAVWVPGKFAQMTTWRMLLSGALFYGAKMGKETIHNISLVGRHVDPERKKLMKNKSYQYLMILGISSAAQGRGLGGKLLEAVKEDCRIKGVHLYLETEKEENLAFYRKHGFSVLKKIELAELQLPMWLMECSPQYQ